MENILLSLIFIFIFSELYNKKEIIKDEIVLKDKLTVQVI
jgi:hypothetical protein